MNHYKEIFLMLGQMTYNFYKMNLGKQLAIQKLSKVMNYIKILLNLMVAVLIFILSIKKNIKKLIKQLRWNVWLNLIVFQVVNMIFFQTNNLGESV